MVARQSQLFIPTLREAPADAEAVSHKLLVRGGYIRQVSAGVWTFLPLGWRVHQNVVQIIREEMDAIGGQEMLMPVLTPAELWETTGRDYPEIFRLEDRAGRRFILPMTHEETVTFHAREIQSYRQLPQILYHFSIKERDEPRPRGGLLRMREFIMKDAYTFDRNEDEFARSFELHRQAYHRMLERLGLEFYEVEAESGMMGGQQSQDFLCPAGSGENTLVTCEHGDYAADLEIARGVPRTPSFPATEEVPKEVATPGVTTIESLAELLGIDAAATSKAMPVVKTDGTLVLGLVRGDDRLAESKMLGVLKSDYRPATDEEIRSAFGASGGSLGPVGVSVHVVADDALREGQFVAGANRDGWHLLGVEAGRDYAPRFADIREAREGDRCPVCSGELRFQTAIEVGHIFNFGSRYSEPLGATFLDEDGTEKPLIGGSYGIGPARVMAAVVEQSHDGNGIVWPKSIAPYDVHVLALHGGSAEVLMRAEQLAAALEEGGLDVLYDERDERPGEKFADADLIGCPTRIIVGKKTLDDGAVDVRTRDGAIDERVSSSEVVKWVLQH
ncbi:MAG: proline--tRNA ligase [Actinobacteria bacterium]|nr:proline--tRNA ligase [Actinomycetota bacterium]MBA3566821.1 proline--tRNA ligase [Actinomycetota bacterium]MDQ3425659.1 proline--tRNA ligase [Actinomycetota bacterium]